MFHDYITYIPVPGNIRLNIKQIQAKPSGICGTAWRNIPCFILGECEAFGFVDRRLFNDAFA